MRCRRWTRSIGVVIAVLIVGACSLFDDTNFEVTISASSSFTSPSEPVTLTVKAENRGGSRVVWGQGSSSCQLGSLVRVEGRDFPAPDLIRPCTADLVDFGLDPGESQTESWNWAGYIVRGDSTQLLPPGTYQVRGAAGNVAVSAPIDIEIVEEEVEP